MENDVEFGHNHAWDSKSNDPCPACDRVGRRYEPDGPMSTSEEVLDQYNPHRPKTREVQRWADKAMYAAEPVDTSGPKVYLLWMTPDPLGAIAAACKMYKGEVVRDLATVTDEERLEYFEQVQKTKLKAPFEFVKFHFLIEGVTRALTHQMVRQRTAAYAQESLRFAVKEDMPFGLPPSITPGGLAEASWNKAIEQVDMAYHELIDMGIPAEDARGLLPHNVLTRLHYTTDLRALLDHAGNRLCTQAQFEWRLVFSRIIEAIRSVDRSPIARQREENNRLIANSANGTTRVYMSHELLDAFKPVCYQTGKCEFKANFDRPCSIRDRVDANERAGRPSALWGEDLMCHSDGCDHPEVEISAIKPGEWLLDSTAARRRN